MRFWMLLVVMCAAGCATPYQRMSLMGGYDDEQVGLNEYVIRFQGNGYTSMGLSYQYAMRRAAELCPGGYDVLDGMGSSSQSTFVYANRRTFAAHSVSKPEVMTHVRCRPYDVRNPPPMATPAPTPTAPAYDYSMR